MKESPSSQPNGSLYCWKTIFGPECRPMEWLSQSLFPMCECHIWSRFHRWVQRPGLNHQGGITLRLLQLKLSRVRSAPTCRRCVMTTSNHQTPQQSSHRSAEMTHRRYAHVLSLSAECFLSLCCRSIGFVHPQRACLSLWGSVRPPTHHREISTKWPKGSSDRQSRLMLLISQVARLKAKTSSKLQT